MRLQPVTGLSPRFAICAVAVAVAFAGVGFAGCLGPGGTCFSSRTQRASFTIAPAFGVGNYTALLPVFVGGENQTANLTDVLEVATGVADLTHVIVDNMPILLVSGQGNVTLRGTYRYANCDGEPPGGPISEWSTEVAREPSPGFNLPANLTVRAAQVPIRAGAAPLNVSGGYQTGDGHCSWGIGFEGYLPVQAGWKTLNGTAFSRCF